MNWVEDRSPVHVVDSEDLFEYPIPSSERLGSHHFMPWHHSRWLHSEFRLLADEDVRGVAVDLFSLAQNESPVGTLPVDERVLSSLAGVPLDRWRSLCERAIGPLYKWRRCRCDNGHIRLWHPVVLEVAQEALGRRVERLSKQEADRERKRLDALPEQMLRAGAPTGMTEDKVLVLQFDQYLLDHFEGKQRRAHLVREALEAWSLAMDGGPRGGVPGG